MKSLLSLLVLVWVALPTAVHGDDPKIPRIDVGTYLNQVNGIDLKNNNFSVDFWVWFRWTDPSLKPMDTFEVIGGRITSKGNFVRKDLEGGVHYAACRVTATITKYWDLTRFPFDDHTLVIQVEDGSDIDESRAIYRADIVNSGIDPDVAVSGWSVASSRSEIQKHRYTTNYGDTSLATGAESIWSRYRLHIELKRAGRGRFLKVFFGLFMATLVSWCGFFIRPKDASPRVSVAVGALFAAAAVMVSLNNALPDSNSITLGDKLIFMSLGTILMSLFGTVASLTLNYFGKEKAYRTLDKVSAIIFPIAYLTGLTLIVKG